MKGKAKVLAVCGMTGSGKSKVVSLLLKKHHFAKAHFGEKVDGYAVQKWGEWTPEKSKKARIELREKDGPLAIANLVMPDVVKAYEEGKNVLLDGLYSWSEYKLFKDRFGDDFFVITVHASPQTRYARLGSRNERPMTSEQAKDRDYSEIEQIEKGGPIAMSDYVVVNESSLEDLEQNLDEILKKLLQKG